MRKRNYLLSLAAASILSIVSLTGCSSSQEAATLPETNITIEEAVLTETILETEETIVAETTEAGILFLKVNPEIAIYYDDNGLVTKLGARNTDAKNILKNYTGYEGKAAHEVVKDLVALIDDAGYFVEEVEGIHKQITIEIEVGSRLPNDQFVDTIVTEVKDYVASKDQNSPIHLEGATDYDTTDYGTTSYDVTDYGTTDYQTPTASSIPAAPSTAPVQSAQPAVPESTVPAATDYDATDYAVTDYNEPATDYNVTDYNEPATDYNVTDYNTTDYDNSSDYDD